MGIPTWAQSQDCDLTGLNEVTFLEEIMKERSKGIMFRSFAKTGSYPLGQTCRNMKEIENLIDMEYSGQFFVLAFRNVSQRHLLFPIPAREMILNKKLTQTPIGNERISINLKKISKASAYIVLLIGGLVGITACDPEMELSGNVEDFTVTLLTPKIKAGEQAVFEFTGDPDLISMFTGELYSEYDCKDHRILESGDYNLSFSTATKYGAQENHFSILISSDFNGDYSNIPM